MQEQEEKTSGNVGAVLVVGGGVGGVQASLDLADAGYHVYLLEQTPAIGGVMAQLTRPSPPMIVPCVSSPPSWLNAGGT